MKKKAQEEMKKKAQEEIKKILFEADKKISKLKYKGVSKEYKTKIGYMVFWLRLIPCNYKFLNNWSMPDMGTISEITARKEKLK